MAACSPTYSHNLTFFIIVSHHLEDLQSLNTYSTMIWIIKCLLHDDISERMAKRIQHSLHLLTNTAILRVSSALRFYAEIRDNTWKKWVFPVYLLQEDMCWHFKVLSVMPVIWPLQQCIEVWLQTNTIFIWLNGFIKQYIISVQSATARNKLWQVIYIAQKKQWC